jgi:hypothetical protein
MDETQRSEEFQRMWRTLSPGVRTSLMTDPDKLWTPDEAIRVTGSGKIPVAMLDGYWVASQSGPTGSYLTQAFKDFVVGKRSAPPQG